jgi:hypothetical protein
MSDENYNRSPLIFSYALIGALFLLLPTLRVAGKAETASAYHDPAEIVRKAVRNEIQAASGDFAHFQFRGVKSTPKGSITRIYVETKEAIAGLVVAYDGRPLTAEQRQTEDARIERYIDHPEELKKKRDQEHENAEHTLRIMRALPDAFLYEYAGEEPGSVNVGAAGDTLVKLGFRPNPRYSPPSHVEEVLTGMQGYILVDTAKYRIANIDGTLFKEVGFGWGILGHLNSGGRFVVKQADIGDNVWEISSMTLDFTGKIMVFKNLAITSNEVFSEFKKVPQDLTFAQALELLKTEEGPVTASGCCQKIRLSAEVNGR